MKKTLLSEILTPSVKTLPPQASVSEALEVMAAAGISCIVVVDAGRRPLGIFTERDVVRLLAEQREIGALKMADVMSAPPFTSPADVDFREAFRMLQEQGFRHLVVVDERGCLSGVVSEGDFMHHLEAGDLAEFKSVEKVMSRNVATVDAGDTLADAICLMNGNRYSCVVVTRAQIPYGILTERDVVKLAMSAAAAACMAVGSVAHTPLVTVPPGTTLPEAIGQMDRHNIRHLAITEGDRLLGILTRHDLVKTLQGSYVNFLHETIQAQRKELFELSQQRRLFELHEAALAATANAMLIADRQAVIQWANPAFSRLTGYALEEAVGKPIRDLVKSGENSAELYDALWEAILGGRVWQGEIVNRRKDGTLCHEEMTVTPVRIGGGEITHFIAVKQDITGRKAIQGQMERQLAFNETVLNAEVNALAVCHEVAEFPHIRFTIWSPGMEALTGYGMEEINRLGWYQTVYIEPEVQERARQRMERMRRGDHLRGEEWSITRKDGERRIVLINTATVAEDDLGTHVMAVVHDITGRKRVEAALAESEQRFRAVFQNSADAILLHPLVGEGGGFGRFIEANDTAIARYGYSREELLGMTPVELDEVRTYPAPEDLKVFQDNARRSGHLLFERIHVAKDGRRILVEVSSHIFELQGETMMLSVVRDITERKKHEEELKRSNAELEQFSYAVSHDMRQPLRMVSSYLQLIETELADQLDSEKRGYFEFAIEGAKRIDQMLVELLEYSRIGRLGEPLTWADSRALLDEALQYLQPAIAEAQARLNITGEWPRILVCHDEILRLIQNLVENAVKFRLAGRAPEITIGSEIVANEWRLHIADNGIGIIPDQIKRLFQVFQRLQLRTAYEGSGVGLALCRKIAEHHKGRIWAESEGEGKGSKFCVVLPVLQEDEAAPARGQTA